MCETQITRGGRDQGNQEEPEGKGRPKRTKMNQRQHKIKQTEARGSKGKQREPERTKGEEGE